VGKRRAGAHGDDEFARLVAADAGQRPHVERLAARHFAVERFGTAAADVERALVGTRGPNALDDRFQRSVAHAQ